MFEENKAHFLLPWQRAMLAVVSSSLVYLSSPGSPFPLLFWIWPVPLGIALIGLRPLHASLLAGGCAWLFWVFSIWWLVPAIIQFVHVQSYIALILLALVCLLCALPYAVFGAVFAKFKWLNRKVGVFRVSVAYAVILSWIPSLIPGNPVHSQYQNPLLIQLLDLGGLPLLLFFTALIPWAFVNAVFERKYPHKVAISLGVVFTVSALICLYGYFRMETIHHEMVEGEQVRIGVIQPNLLRDDKLTPLYLMTEDLLKKRDDLDLVVWPEFPPAFSVIDSATNRNDTLSLSQHLKVPLMLVSGYVYTEGEEEKPRSGYYNASHLIEDGELKSTYYKRTLVPFFEYLPMESHMGWLRELFPKALHYVPGKQVQLFPLGRNINIIPPICYEVIFSSELRDFISAGGNIIINPVSDTWFGRSSGSHHHFSLALFRSVEYRVPFIRVANSGISAFVEASGEIVPGSLTPLMEQHSQVFSVSIPKRGPMQLSAYAAWGDWFLYLITIVFIADCAVTLSAYRFLRSVS